MSQTSTSNGLCLPCGLHEFERNRYFDGKLLVTRDFQEEQNYLRGKDRLHNSLLHGTGTVCGLKVEQHPNPACRHQYVLVQPGLALDCCGNEIVVQDEQTVDLRALIEAALRERGLFPENGAPQPANVYLRIAYRECDTEPVPALLDDCGCEGSNIEHNRTAEGYRLLVDLDEPAGSASDPLDARLEWRHTLATSHPRALVVDRDLQRLYVADWDGSRGWLRMYDTATHSLVHPALALGEVPAVPLAAGRSNLGDLVYVAAAVGDGGNVRILIFEQNLLETDPAAALRASLRVNARRLAGLAVSPIDDSLYVLLPTGRLLRWSSNSIRDWAADPSGSQPAPTAHDLSDVAGGIAAGDMTISHDGRWMVVADTARPRLVALNLAQFGQPGPVANLMKRFALPAGHIPHVVEFSYDSEYLYVLGGESQMLYRIQVRDRLDDFIPVIPDEGNTFSAVQLASPPATGEPPKPLPLDLGVSPRDNWLYVLRREFDGAGEPRDRGEVLILSVDAINERRGPATSDLEDPETAAAIRRGAVNTRDNALFQNLAFLGQRLYVAGETLPASAEDEPIQGNISILYVNEAACDAFIDRAIDGCAACEDAGQGVILASIRGYQWDQPMTTDAGATVNLIDNLAHRPMVPSTNTLRQVIQCMLDKGISEGIPGPRGAAGPAGEAGPRGPGISAAQANTLPPGSAATAALLPIPGDPEGDLALRLGIPRGADGAPGSRGPGITEAVANTLPPGSNATATLQPIPGSPTGDQRVILGIPRGDPGQGATPEEFNQVILASWHHDEVITGNEFVERLAEVGLVVVFRDRVRLDAVHHRNAFVRILHAQETSLGMLECECVLPMQVEAVDPTGTADVDVRWLVGANPIDDRFKLVTDVQEHPGGDFCQALRLRPPEEWSDPARLKQLIASSGRRRLTLTVVLRSAWILDERDRALDGDHIWPGVPEGPTATGVDGRSSGNGTEGGDWMSVLHIVDG